MFHPEPPDLSKHGGTDVKRTSLEWAEGDSLPEGIEAKERRYMSRQLVEDKVQGSFLAVTGTNQIQAKDPISALGVSVDDRKAPGWVEEKGHDPFTDAV